MALDEGWTRVENKPFPFKLLFPSAQGNFVVDQLRQASRHRSNGVLTRLGEGGQTEARELLWGQTGSHDESTPVPEAVADRLPATPEEEFERAWARALVEQAVAVFRQECADRRREPHFAVFERHLW